MCIQYVYSISLKSMRSKSRKGWTCCRTSSSTSTHSASKTNKSYTGNVFRLTWIVSVYMKALTCKFRPILWLFCVANVSVWIHVLPVQFLSGWSESCGQPETIHRKTGHRSAHGEKTSCFLSFTWLWHLYHISSCVSSLFFLSRFLKFTVATD